MSTIFHYFSSIQFHPLVFFVATFIGGIATQACLTASYVTIFLTYFLCIAFIVFFKKSTLLRLFLLSGFLLGVVCYKKKLDDYESFCTNFCNKSYDIVAQVIDKQIKDGFQQKTSLKLSTQELYNRKTEKKYKATISCIAYCADTMNTISIGDTVKFSNIFMKQSKNYAFSRYLLKEGCYISFFAKNIPEILNRPKYSLERNIFNEKIQMLSTLKNKMSFQCYTLFSSLFLGNKTLNKKYLGAIKEQFKYWGLSHYLARSGLHLMIFLLLFTFLLRLIPFSRSVKTFILTILCLLYALFSWSSISFTRALLTYLFYYCYIFFNCQINTLHILSLITCIILIINPLQLFFLDFQLSFGLTFALVLISHAKIKRKKIAQPLPH